MYRYQLLDYLPTLFEIGDRPSDLDFKELIDGALLESDRPRVRLVSSTIGVPDELITTATWVDPAGVSHPLLDTMCDYFHKGWKIDVEAVSSRTSVTQVYYFVASENAGVFNVYSVQFNNPGYSWNSILSEECIRCTYYTHVIGGSTTVVRSKLIYTNDTPVPTYSDLGALSDRVTSNTNLLGEHTSELAAHDTELSSHASQLESQSSELASHASQLESQSGELSSHASQLVSQSQAIDALEVVTESHTSELATHASQLSTHTSQIGGLTSSVSTITSDLATAKGNIQDLQTSVGDLTTGQENLDTRVTSLEEDLQSMERFRGYFMTRAELDALSNPRVNDYAYVAEIVAPSTTSNRWVYTAGDPDAWVDSGVPLPDQIIPPSDLVPLMDAETGSAGTQSFYSRGDHVHPFNPLLAKKADLTPITDRLTDVESSMDEVVDKLETVEPGAQPNLVNSINRSSLTYPDYFPFPEDGNVTLANFRAWAVGAPRPVRTTLLEPLPRVYASLGTVFAVSSKSPISGSVSHIYTVPEGVPNMNLVLIATSNEPFIACTTRLYSTGVGGLITVRSTPDSAGQLVELRDGDGAVKEITPSTADIRYQHLFTDSAGTIWAISTVSTVNGQLQFSVDRLSQAISDTTFVRFIDIPVTTDSQEMYFVDSAPNTFNISHGNFLYNISKTNVRLRSYDLSSVLVSGTPATNLAFHTGLTSYGYIWFNAGDDVYRIDLSVDTSTPESMFSIPGYRGMGIAVAGLTNRSAYLLGSDGLYSWSGSGDPVALGVGAGYTFALGDSGFNRGTYLLNGDSVLVLPNGNTGPSTISELAGYSGSAECMTCFADYRTFFGSTQYVYYIAGTLQVPVYGSNYYNRVEVVRKSDFTAALSRLDALESTAESLSTTVSEISSSLDDIGTMISGLESSVTGLQSSVSSIESSVSTIETSVSGLETSVSGLESDVSGLNSGLSNVMSAVTALGARVTPLESDVTTLKGVLNGISGFWTGTQAEYDAIATKDPNTDYRIYED